MVASGRQARRSVAAQAMLEVVQELAWEGFEAPHAFIEDGCDLVLQFGLLNTTERWSDLLHLLLGSQLDAVRRLSVTGLGQLDAEVWGSGLL